jgi:hypothetical protein
MTALVVILLNLVLKPPSATPRPPAGRRRPDGAGLVSP